MKRTLRDRMARAYAHAEENNTTSMLEATIKGRFKTYKTVLKKDTSKMSEFMEDILDTYYTRFHMKKRRENDKGYYS